MGSSSTGTRSLSWVSLVQLEESLCCFIFLLLVCVYVPSPGVGPSPQAASQGNVTGHRGTRGCCPRSVASPGVCPVL